MKDLNTFEECAFLFIDGSIGKIESHFSTKKSLIKFKTKEFGFSLLHLAAWFNRPDICEYLISKGLDPDIQEPYSKKTPLHIASYLGHMESVFALTKNGAEALFSKNTFDMIGCHPIHYAAMQGNKEMIDYFLKMPQLEKMPTNRSLCSLRKLSAVGNVLDILIRKKFHGLLEYYSPIGGPHAVETNPRIFSAFYMGYSNEHQWTPFHYAAVLGDIEALKILLNHFPYASCLDPDFQEDYSFFPGEVALAEGHIEAARLFGHEENLASYRNSLKTYYLRNQEENFMMEWLDALIDRNEKLLDDLLKNHGPEFLAKQSFNSRSRTYRMDYKLNLYSIACRAYAFSFLNGLIERGVEVPDKEFDFPFVRDAKEASFFNWALMETHPGGEGFFKKIESLFYFLKIARD